MTWGGNTGYGYNKNKFSYHKQINSPVRASESGNSISEGFLIISNSLQQL